MKLRIRKDGDKYYPEVKKFLGWSPIYVDCGFDFYPAITDSVEEAEIHIRQYIKSYVKRDQWVVKEYEV